ncbi:hypothetical protein AU468_08415 [Alkalispirochaeta sphaeroplastigenens]|uniref:ABC transporter ATP-binding protein n=2 Tax=Alkalispirochaeta sphaeroplastigenens TaxID=1187066 RepID=A0A2S4JP83_9SPIO|nr:hypothetical protein AU468_08415 [Alkalispirochaeta sphaeroplastigenens]
MEHDNALRSTLKILWPFLRPYRLHLAGAFGAMFLVDGFAYIVPVIVAYATDHIYPSLGEPAGLRRLAALSGGLLALAFLRGIAVHLMIRAFWFTAEAAVRDLRNSLYHKLQHLETAFYDQARTGDLMSRATWDIQLIRNFIAFGLEHRLRISLISGTIFLLMLFQDWRLALAVYTAIPLFIVAIISYSRRMRHAGAAQQREMGRLNTHIQENITGIRIVKAFALEQEETERFDRQNKRMLQRDLESSLLQACLNPILLITDGAGALIVLALGGYRVISGQMSLGTLLAFITYLSVMAFPLRILAFNTALVNQAASAANRVLQILESPDQNQRNTGQCRRPIEGAISFQGVGFHYQPDTPVLRDVSFQIEPGERVALFGLTGAGKSTLISLIPRFSPPRAGTIRIDGEKIENWDLPYLRSRIGTVLQETFLFSATIRDNIAFARPDASDQEIQQAARYAQIHDFIMTLPRGYQTPVGEYGTGLSGGQRQRIAIARTLLQNPRILILDDCTSSLDAVTERRIQQQLHTLMAGRTTIIIAQRVSSLALADRIIVLDKGTVQAVDSHEALLEQNSLYRTIYEKQET